MIAALAGNGTDVDGNRNGDETRSTFRPLTVGDEGSDVGRLEDRLDGLGFNVGPMDGRYDGQMANAVFAFELCWGLSSPDTTADPDMQDELLNTEVDTGTGGDDTLTGTGGDDVIFLREGSDRYEGLGGRDRVCAGENESWRK